MPAAPSTALVAPADPHEWDAVRALMREYAAQLGVDLCFQDFESELTELPMRYGPPRGNLLMARVDGELAGCCGLRPLAHADHANACEMKRLYVRPRFRKLGLGRLLAVGTLNAARQGAYACVLLDTLSGMDSARALYQDLGFVEIPPYYYNPIPGSRYLKAVL